MNAPLSTLKLYEISAAYLETLEALAEIEDLPAEAVADTLQGWIGTFEQKAIAIAAYIRNLEVEAAAVEEARRRMERRQKSLERHANRLRDYLRTEMERTGITKVKSAEVVLRAQKNQPCVVIDNADLLPDAYREQVITIKLLKAEIGKALKAGTQVPGAHLEQTTRLVIQ